MTYNKGDGLSTTVIGHFFHNTRKPYSPSKNRTRRVFPRGGRVEAMWLKK